KAPEKPELWIGMKARASIVVDFSVLWLELEKDFVVEHAQYPANDKHHEPKPDKCGIHTKRKLLAALASSEIQYGGHDDHSAKKPASGSQESYELNGTAQQCKQQPESHPYAIECGP